MPIPYAYHLQAYREAAADEDAAMREDVRNAGDLCLTAAQNLSDLFDRDPEDWGDADAVQLQDFMVRINNLHSEALALLGQPRVRRLGALVPDWSRVTVDLRGVLPVKERS